MTLLLTSLLVALESGGAEAHHEGAGLMPYYIGALALGILLAVLGGLLVFGKGREHS